MGTVSGHAPDGHLTLGLRGLRMMHTQGGYTDLCSAGCNRALAMAPWDLWLAAEGRSQARILGCLYIAAGG
jgi:hypothetical protein